MMWTVWAGGQVKQLKGKKYLIDLLFSLSVCFYRIIYSYLSINRSTRRHYSHEAEKDVTRDAQNEAEEEEELEEMLKQGWFDEDLKAKLKKRRQEKV